MAVKIRLQRFGSKKKPYYRVVVADERMKRDGRFLEQVGTYDPMQNPAKLSMNNERIDYWFSVGAKASDTVASLLRRLKREASAS
ncbi:MAG: 30S ribosomal protein S16 [Myxococcota bacterium]|nr:30S ribosomal protein S16 [Myxococcota bacterium]